MEAEVRVEAEAWQQAVGGSAEAFGVIFDRHRDRVYRHCLRMLGGTHDAEDATAIAFLELWRKRDRVRIVDGSVAPWLLVTATNTARNLSRSRRRYQQFLHALPEAASAPSAEERAELFDVEHPELNAALARLPDADASLFALVALEGYTPAEAAEALNISGSAARTRLHRIRARLQRHLQRTTSASIRAEETS
ncbi:RNA polymerase sigma factor [Leucobacter japonicus]|uniref:RNA polymerase sigma factor n=1 Tax=Leucobacter japonicus TaxID=1461259 RepID=UPI0009497AB1|nr:sigma-70 family RNA polymerase sigma factor [Leucobacter japonicus]